MLYECQEKAVKLAPQRVIFAFGVGCGKTLTAIYHYLKWRQKPTTPLVIFTPKAKVIEGGWNREIARVEASEGVTIPYDVRTIDSIKKLTRHELYTCAFILDECHLYKGQSQRGQAFVSLLNEAWGSVGMLSATPASNGWDDCKNYFAGMGYIKFLNQGKRSKKYEYKQDYASYRLESITGKGGKDVRFRVVDHYKQTPELQAAFDSFTFTLSSDDIGELPKRTFQQVRFASTPLYKSIKRHRVRVFDDGTVEEMDSISKLCHTLRLESATQDKLEYLKMLFEGISANMLVFYVYSEHKEQIIELAKETGKNVYEISGRVKNIPLQDVQNAVIVAQYQAGGAGIELQMCTVSVMFSPTYSYQDYVQALGRNYGGFRQDKHVHVYEFICEGIEEEICLALNQKQDFSEKLFASKHGYDN
jgi:hypothetical protein